MSFPQCIQLSQLQQVKQFKTTRDGFVKFFPIHILTQMAESHKGLEGGSVSSGPQLDAFISTNPNTDYYRMGEHLRSRSCPLNLLYRSIINIIAIKKKKKKGLSKPVKQVTEGSLYLYRVVLTRLLGLLTTSAQSGLETSHISSTQALLWEHCWILNWSSLSSPEHNQKNPAVTFQSLKALNALHAYKAVTLLRPGGSLQRDNSPHQLIFQTHAPDLFL